MRLLVSALTLGTLTSLALAQGSGAERSLVDAAIGHEHAIVKTTIAAHPLVETYLQFYNSPDSAPISDSYSLGELDSPKALREDDYRTPGQHHILELVSDFVKPLLLGTREKILPDTFVDMLSPDAKGFNTRNYRFHFVRPTFIGSRRVEMFDVTPRDKKHITGRFEGRVWIDQQDQTIVRFTGVFESHSANGRPEYLHFDSWRKKSPATGQWRPYAIYIQDRVRGRIFRGRIRLWGYNLGRMFARNSFDANIRVSDAEDESGNSQDVGPLEATRMWRTQAEDNVIGRLQRAGILAQPGNFEKILDQIATNLMIPNNLDFGDPVHVRILLTLPIEATVMNHTILLSKGLIDSIPNEEDMASVLTLELAHIKLGHRLDTMFAFSDELDFSNASTYLHLRFAYTDRENRAAAKLADEYLAKSIYKKKLGDAANYYAILVDREAALKAISHGFLGDSLLDPAGKPWISAALPVTTLKRAEALPLDDPSTLSSMLAVDTDSDRLSRVPRLAPGPGETPHPLEVLPMWLNLKRSPEGTTSKVPAADSTH